MKLLTAILAWCASMSATSAIVVTVCLALVLVGLDELLRARGWRRAFREAQRDELERARRRRAQRRSQ